MIQDEVGEGRAEALQELLPELLFIVLALFGICGRPRKSTASH
ncbi:MAG: hypothetical protein ACRDYZ_15070 [Acidimicrobiales bacterium]